MSVRSYSPQCFNVVLSDEAAAYKLARTIVCQNVNLRHMINYRCMAHVFNLVIFELSRQPGPFPILQKLSQLISIISSHKRLSPRLRQLGACKPQHIIPTRWYSTASALNSVIALESFFPRLEMNDTTNYTAWADIVEQEDFWRGLKDLK